MLADEQVGASHALQCAVAAIGLSIGVLAILLHALAFGDLWDRSVLPVWPPQFSL
jgi:hypothetical protein